MKKYLFSGLLLVHFLFACGPLPKLGPATEEKLATASETDCGFVQNIYGQRVSWKQSLPVKIYIDPGFPPEYDVVLKNAAQKWENVLSRTLFTFERQTQTSIPGRDNRNIVYWQNPWSDSENKLQAMSNLYWKSNQLIEADLKVDAQYFTYYISQPNSALDVHLESLLVHELGHVLGLKHVSSSIPSVMWQVLNYNMKRDLPSAEDQAHIKCEYK